MRDGLYQLTLGRVTPTTLWRRRRAQKFPRGTDCLLFSADRNIGWGDVRWIGALRNFSTIFGYIWRSVSTAGGINCSWKWTSNLPLATDNYLSWDSNPSGEGQVVSMCDALTTRPRRPLSNLGIHVAQIVFIFSSSTRIRYMVAYDNPCCIAYMSLTVTRRSP